LILLYGFQGMKHFYDDIHDISVDVPAAYTLLDTLANKLNSKNVLGDSLMKDLPSRYIYKCHAMLSGLAKCTCDLLDLYLCRACNGAS